MDDKTIMTNILTGVKSACDLYMHGTIESSTPNVRRAFQAALADSLAMQSEIYSKMSEKGWYGAQTAEQTKIEETKQKFQNQNN